jgi:putative transposase
MALKEWFTAQELAGLPGMPGTERRVRSALKKNLAVTRNKTRGKGLEFALKSLPAATQQHLYQQTVAAVLAQAPALAAPAPAASAALVVQSSRALARPDQITLDGSTGADRDQARAIAVVLRKVAEVEQASACSTKAACTALLASARAALLPEMLLQQLRAARDQRGRASPDGLPSVRSLELWVQRQRKGETLVPQKRQPDMTLQLWMVAALELYRRPQKPTLKMVQEQLAAQWDGTWGIKPPSYDQIVYFFKHKYSQADLLTGRYQGSALAAKRAYQKRSSTGLEPFIEVHADGWNTHFTAPHPTNGDFVTLEVWHFHELATRYVTRPAIGLTETSAIILKGLENYIRELGVPAVWQTDSTRSVKNNNTEFDPLTSVAARAGISIVHPVKVGNSQANGIAENWNTWIDRESRELATYQHPRMDSLAHRQVRKFTDKMVKAAKAGDLEGRDSNKRAAERAGKGYVFDSFAQACDWINAKVDKFNAAPHSSLPRITDPATGQRRHQTPAEAVAQARAEGIEPMWMAEDDIVDLFRLHYQRKVRRGVVLGYEKQDYSHPELAHYEGQEVLVAIDIMDGQTVWVKDLQQRVLCQASFVPVTGYRPKSFYEFSLEKRMGQQLRRLEKKADKVQERMAPDAIEMQSSTAQVLDIHGLVLTGLSASTVAVTPEPAAETPKEHPITDIAMYLYGDEVARQQDVPPASSPDHDPWIALLMQEEREREAREQQQQQAAQGGQ